MLLRALPQSNASRAWVACHSSKLPLCAFNFRPHSPLQAKPCASHAAMALAIAKAQALWDFAGEDSGDLPFKAGDELDILEKEGDWWRARREGQEGNIPGVYVKITKEYASIAPKRPPPKQSPAQASQPGARPAGAVASGQAEACTEQAVKQHEAGWAAGQREAFSIDSLEAFDELMERGYAVLRGGEPGKGAGEGQLVDIAYTLSVWDGSSATARQIERVTSCSFTLGRLDPFFTGQATEPDAAAGVPPPPGLHDALSAVPAGGKALLVLAPETAFGAEGLSPHVPVLAHLVYDLQVRSVAGQATRAGGASGTAARPTAQAAAGSRSDEEQEEVGELAASISSRYGAWAAKESSRASFAPHAGRAAGGGQGGGAAVHHGGHRSAMAPGPAQATPPPMPSTNSAGVPLHELPPEEAEAIVRARLEALGQPVPPPGSTRSSLGKWFSGMKSSLFGAQGIQRSSSSPATPSSRHGSSQGSA